MYPNYLMTEDGGNMSSIISFAARNKMNHPGNTIHTTKTESCPLRVLGNPNTKSILWSSQGV